MTFAFALCYILQSSVLIHSIRPIKRELVKLNTLAVVGFKGSDHHAALETQVEKAGWCRADCLDPALFGGFQEFRDKFLEQHELPPAFLFDRYLTGRWVVVSL